MLSKRKKTKRAQPPTRSESEEFLWHLRRPFLGEFSHQHWWEDGGKAVEMEAAIWEILRRHPFVEWFIIQTLIDWEADRSSQNWSPEEAFVQENLDPYWQNRRPHFIEHVRMWSYKNRPAGWDFDFVLESYGLYSWLELPKREQKYWKEEIQNLQSQHGFQTDRSEAVEIIPDINRLPKQTLANLRAAAKSQRAAPGEKESLKKLWAAEHCGNALEEFASGYLLIKFNPYLPNVDRLVSEQVRSAVRKWRRFFPLPADKWNRHRPPGRARISDWLAIIKSFEQAELSRDGRTKRDDQLFARYRRIIKAWDF
jgi:hypothetical protein